MAGINKKQNGMGNTYLNTGLFKNLTVILMISVITTNTAKPINVKLMKFSDCLLNLYATNIASNKNTIITTKWPKLLVPMILSLEKLIQK